MRLIETLAQHPDVRRQRFPEHLWPRTGIPTDDKEIWIFLEFTLASGLRLDTAPTKEAPPRPDIQCTVKGERIRFELGEILQTSLGEGTAHSVKEAPKKMDALAEGDHAEAQAIRTADYRRFPANAALNRILRQKLAKHYETDGYATHLLLFYDTQTPLAPFSCLLQFETELLELIARSDFQRVWIFRLPSPAVIGYLEVAANRGLRAVFDEQFHPDLKSPLQVSAVWSRRTGRTMKFERYG